MDWRSVQFSVRFRELMGTPPASYLTEWYILRARRLLLQTELSITDFATRVGYGSDAAFLRAFKRRFGETPSKLCRTQNAVFAKAPAKLSFTLSVMSP
ncbi:MAG: helix-turn-helix transcriptional regulator [Rhizobiaceae bacterium]